jgi:hypothetical protein
MQMFRFPLSGNVTQTINPWNWLFNPVGSQVGLVNIELGPSANPPVEEEILTSVASYGKQLGRIEDVLEVLLAHFHPAKKLTTKGCNRRSQITDERHRCSEEETPAKDLIPDVRRKMQAIAIGVLARTHTLRSDAKIAIHQCGW